MAFDQTNQNENTGKTRKEATAFLNIHLPHINGENQHLKLGYLVLYESNPDHTEILEVLTANPERAQELASKLIIDFRINEPRTVTNAAKLFD